jgi:hypothetical protein
MFTFPGVTDRPSNVAPSPRGMFQTESDANGHRRGSRDPAADGGGGAGGETVGGTVGGTVVVTTDLGATVVGGRVVVTGLVVVVVRQRHGGQFVAATVVAGLGLLDPLAGTLHAEATSAIPATTTPSRTAVNRRDPAGFAARFHAMGTHSALCVVALEV